MIVATSRTMSRYEFDDFVVGRSNRLAYEAAIQVTEEPGGVYNPLFIYGDGGTGKTHLLNAIGNNITRNYPGMRIVLSTAGSFARDLKSSLGGRRYRTNCDVLLLDDLQVIVGEPRVQGELLQILDELGRRKCQIVLTSSGRPSELPGLSDDLSARLCAGLVVKIGPADIATRISIIRALATRKDLEILQDVAEYAASRLKASAWDLGRFVDQVCSSFSQLPGVVTIDTARRVLDDRSRSAEEHWLRQWGFGPMIRAQRLPSSTRSPG